MSKGCYIIAVFLSFLHFKLAHPRVMTTEAQVSSCCDILCKVLKLVSNSQRSLTVFKIFHDGWSTYLCSARTNWHLFLKILSMQSIFCQADDNMDFSFPFLIFIGHMKLNQGNQMRAVYAAGLVRSKTQYTTRIKLFLIETHNAAGLAFSGVISDSRSFLYFLFQLTAGALNASASMNVIRSINNLLESTQLLDQRLDQLVCCWLVAS